MRILIVTDSFPPRAFGGIAQHAWHIARFLSVRHDILVLTLRKDKGRVAPKDESFPVRPLLTKRFPKLDFWVVRRVACSFRADVVHCCTAGLVDERLSLICPVVTRTVGNDLLRPWCGYNLPWRSLLYRLPNRLARAWVGETEMRIRRRKVVGNLRASHMIVANSAWTRARLIEVGMPVGNLRVIVGGVDTEVFRPPASRMSTRTHLGLPSQVQVLLTAANLVAKKGIDTVVRVVARMSEAIALRYVIVGDGPERENLLRLIRQLGVEDRVSLVGRLSQTELARFYQAADAYVLVSLEETMGRTFFEAGACGIPVIGARVGGVPDVVRHGENGLLVKDPENVVNIAACVRKLLVDEGLRARMGAIGLQRARTQFSWDVVGPAFESVLEDAVNAQV